MIKNKKVALKVHQFQSLTRYQQQHHHNRSDIRHTPHQSLHQRDEPSWLQSLEREALQNAAEERKQGQDPRKIQVKVMTQSTLLQQTHVSCPGKAISIVAHQCHETRDKQAPLCMGTGTAGGIVNVIPLHQNLHNNMGGDFTECYKYSNFKSNVSKITYH